MATDKSSIPSSRYQNCYLNKKYDHKSPVSKVRARRCSSFSTFSFKPQVTGSTQKFQQEEDEQNHYLKLGIHASVLWKHRKVTDVVVKLGRREYPAHKPVLSCYSMALKDILLGNKPDLDVINVDKFGITNEAFEILLYFMYTGELNVTCSNIGDVYTAGRKLKIEKALDECIDIFKGKTNPITQPLYIYATAKGLGELETANRALRAMAKHFEQVVCTEEFLQLSHDQVYDLLSYNELAVRSEVIVYLSALKWISADFFDREPYIVKILSCVRFSLMTLNEILACHSPPILPGVTLIPEVKMMLLKATCYVAARTVNEEKLFQDYASAPRKYLIKRNALILWDPHIYDPKRYALFQKDTAATKIQASYRGYKSRENLTYDIDESFVPKKPWFGWSKRNRVRSLEDFESGMSSYGEKNKVHVPYTTETVYNPFKYKPEFKRKRHIGGFASRITAAAAEKYHDIVRIFRNASESAVDDITLSSSEIKVNDDIEEDPGNFDIFSNINTIQMSETSDSVESDNSVHKNAEPNENIDSCTNICSREKLDTGVILVLGGTDIHQNDQSAGKPYVGSPIEVGKSILRYVPALNEWTEFDEMLLPRHHMCAVYLDGHIYCIGGCDPVVSALGKFVPERSCFRYVVDTKEWSQLASMNYPRMYHGAAVIKKQIYVIGGKDDENMMLNSLECYIAEDNTWKLLNIRMNSPKMGIGVCEYRNQIYVVGGMVMDSVGQQRIVSDVECYDPFDDKFCGKIPKLPVPLCFTSLSLCQERIYVVGGITHPNDEDNAACSTTHVFFYDFETRLWLPCCPLPSPRHLSSTVTFGDTIFAIDGLTTFPSTSMSELLMYEVKKNVWKTGEPLPTLCCGVSAVLVPNIV